MVAPVEPQVINGRCPPCVEAYGLQGKPKHFGSDPKCAFWDAGGQFNADNWNCALMGVLRTEAERVWNEGPPHHGRALLTADDQRCAVIRVDELLGLRPDDSGFDPDFLILSWYKSRGGTEGAWCIDQSHLRPLDFSLAMELATEIKARG